MEKKNCELNATLITTAQATIAKSQFLSNMSHEIRTPLNAIFGFSSVVLKSTLQPRQYDFVQKLNSAGESLLKIINDILDFSKIEAGQFDIEPIPFMLEPALANVINIVQQKFTNNHLLWGFLPIDREYCDSILVRR